MPAQPGGAGGARKARLTNGSNPSAGDMKAIARTREEMRAEEKEDNMALTRSFLKGMGLTDEQISSIIEAHTDVTDGLKNQIAQYKADAEKLTDVQRELDGLKAQNGDDWKTKYEAEHTAFDTFKADVAKKEEHGAKEAAFRALLKEAGIADKRMDTVVKVSDIDGIKLNKDGKIADADKLRDSLTKEWPDFITGSKEEGANTPNPPANVGGQTMTKADIFKIKDAAERQKAIAENINLFRKEE